MDERKAINAKQPLKILLTIRYRIRTLQKMEAERHGQSWHLLSMAGESPRYQAQSADKPTHETDTETTSGQKPNPSIPNQPSKAYADQSLRNCHIDGLKF